MHIPRKLCKTSFAAKQEAAPAAPNFNGMETKTNSPFQTALATTPEEREAIFALRMEVFVEEQGVPAEEELDAWDVTATHVLARLAGDGQIIGTARLLDYGEGKAVIGRVAVHKDFRGQGVGAILMRFVEGIAAAQGFRHLELGAQCYAIPFYEKLGYTAYGEIYLDCAIEHRHMSKDL